MVKKWVRFVRVYEVILFKEKKINKVMSYDMVK